MNPRYTIECWPHGWTLSAPRGESGLPLEALNESMKLFPKASVICSDIAHHLKVTKFPKVVICVAVPAKAIKWRSVIEETIKHLTPEYQWWCGLDVGTSSACIFSCFCNASLTGMAREMGGGSVPMDSSDFGRCERLLQKFPEWRARLGEVAAAFPNTYWPAVIARWDDLEKADATGRSRILDEILSSPTH